MTQKGPSRANATTVQRSFRLSRRTLGMLDERARELDESRNGLAERLLDEALHTDRHPLIAFREGAGGGRRPALLGTRLYVGQVVESLRANGSDVAETAAYLDVSEAQVRAVVDYYAEFTDEVNAQIAEERELQERERDRWERAQRVLE